MSNTTELLDVRKPINTKDIINQTISNIKEGLINPLEAFTVLKRMSKVSEEVLKDESIKDLANTEFEKYIPELKGKKSVEVYGAQISKSAVHTYYEFGQCGHEVLDELYRIQSHVKHEIARIEDELKLLIPNDDYKAGSIPGFGIENTKKTVVFEKMPKLTYEDYGVVGEVERPKKIQKIGLRYNKL